MSQPKDVPAYNRIPKKVELFGRAITIVDDTELLYKVERLGEARYADNTIALAYSKPSMPEEEKITYLHELIHMILHFTGFNDIMKDGGKIDEEQFVELLASGIYQAEKSARY